jgi:hypothetical protein
VLAFCAGGMGKCFYARIEVLDVFSSACRVSGPKCSTVDTALMLGKNTMMIPSFPTVV